MPLQQLNLSFSLSWLLQAANTGFGNSTEGPDSISANLAGVSVSTWNQLYAAQFTVAASANHTIDLSTGLTNLVNESFGFSKVLAMVIKSSGGSITWSPAASNGFSYNLAGTTPTYIVHDGAVFAASEGATATGIVVDSTHKNLFFSNTGGTTSTVTVVIAGKT